MKDPLNLSLSPTDFSTYYESIPAYNDPFTLSIWEAVGLGNERCEDMFPEQCKMSGSVDPHRRDDFLTILLSVWSLEWEKFQKDEYTCKDPGLTVLVYENICKLFFIGRTGELMVFESIFKDGLIGPSIQDLKHRYEVYNERK
jgi:hypothetical protein